MVRLPGIAQMLGASQDADTRCRGGRSRRGRTPSSRRRHRRGRSAVVVVAAVAGVVVAAAVARAGVVVVVVEAAGPELSSSPPSSPSPWSSPRPRRRPRGLTAGAARVVGVLGLVAGAGDVDAAWGSGACRRLRRPLQRGSLACSASSHGPEMSIAVGRSVVCGRSSVVSVVVSVVSVVRARLGRADRRARVVARLDRREHDRGEQAHHEDRQCECHELAHDPRIGAGRPGAAKPGLGLGKGHYPRAHGFARRRRPGREPPHGDSSAGRLRDARRHGLGSSPRPARSRRRTRRATGARASATGPTWPSCRCSWS